RRDFRGSGSGGRGARGRPARVAPPRSRPARIRSGGPARRQRRAQGRPAGDRDYRRPLGWRGAGRPVLTIRPAPLARASNIRAMHGLLFVRAVFVVVVVYSAMVIAPLEEHGFVNAGLGLAVALMIVLAETRLRETAVTSLLGGL